MHACAYVYVCVCASAHKRAFQAELQVFLAGPLCSLEACNLHPQPGCSPPHTQDGDSAVDRALREHEAEQQEFEEGRDSGGSRKSPGLDGLRSLQPQSGRASRGAETVAAGQDRQRGLPPRPGRASQEIEAVEASEIRLEDGSGWASKASGSKGMSMARENGGASRPSGGWDLVLESANRRKEYEAEEEWPAEQLRPWQQGARA
eukprot:1158309-Pelagomonas_calceolata.AAC.20